MTTQQRTQGEEDPQLLDTGLAEGDDRLAAQEAPAWRIESATEWSEQALDATEEFSAAIEEVPEVAHNFKPVNLDDPDFRPSWMHDPHDGTAEQVTRATESFSRHQVATDERIRMADTVATLMTKNAWDEVARAENAGHPDSNRIYEKLVDNMEEACQTVVHGLVRGEPATVIRGLISAIEHDNHARQFNRAGTTPPES